MIKIQIRYKTEDEKQKMVDIISTGAKIKKISSPYSGGKYYTIYLDIE